MAIFRVSVGHIFGQVFFRCGMLALAATTVLIAAPATADTDDLPDIGSPSDAILSRQLESQIGR